MTLSNTVGCPAGPIRNTLRRILIVAVMLAAILSAVQALAAARSGSESSRSLWLSQFEGGPVVVTFVKAAPGKNQVAEGQLISAEVSGLVLRFPKETDKFFCYANIISVDPR